MMTPHKKWTPLGLSWLFLLAASPAHAQVASLGKGWLLDLAGSVTSAPAEVISGRNSIKGSYSGPNSFTGVLGTDPTFIQFAPNQSYTITFSYRVVTTLSAGLQFGFFSPVGSNHGHFLNDPFIQGGAGASGTATGTITLGSETDYQVQFKIVGTGAIAIDDIRITTSAGQLVASENAEGPTVAPGPLNFQVTDAIALKPEAGSNTVAHSVAVRDLDGDGYPETILTLSDFGNASTTPLHPIIIEASGRMRLATADFFPTGAPTVGNSPVTVFADINNDGLQDILFAEAGNDSPPGQATPGEVASGIGVALNLGGGKFRNVSSLVPAYLQTTHSYALAAGDLDGDGRVEIVLPDEPYPPTHDGSLTSLLRWNGNGFDAQRNWIAPSLWTGQTDLDRHSAMVVADLDKDGRQDLIVSGTASAESTPSLRILFGAPGGFTSAGLVQLPDGLFGHTPPFQARPLVTQAADVEPVVVADFNNDGLPDIFATEEQVLYYQPGVYTDTNDPTYAFVRANGGPVYADMGIQVLINQGSRNFVDVTSTSSAQNLGRRYYSSLIPIDINNDGFMDIVGVYLTKQYAGVQMLWGTTFFLNDGTGAFQVVDGAQLLGATTTPSNGQRWNLGSFVPTLVNPQRTEGIVFESVGGCGGPAFCAVRVLNLYKVVANASIGTGPGFADSASLGVPGFNEWYYLRHYPDAAAAVQAGQYANGLAHYVAVGRGRGYLAHAPAGNAAGLPAPPTALVATSSGTSVTLTWTAPTGGGALSTYIIEAGSSPGAADLASFSTGSTATTFSATGIRAGTYYVRVRAANAAGSSGPSAEAILVVGGGSCTAAPGAPSNLTVVSISGGTVVLAWNAATGDSTSYIVEAGSGPGATNLANSDLGSAATSLTATNVARGIYYVRMRGKNLCGVGPASNEIVVNVP